MSAQARKKLGLLFLALLCLYLPHWAQQGAYVTGIGPTAVGGGGGGGCEPGSNGYNVRTGSGTCVARTFLEGLGIILTNPDGVSGATEISVSDGVFQSLANEQSGAARVCVSSTGSDTYACSMSPTLGAYTNGMLVTFIPTGASNVGAASLNIDSRGDVAIKKCDGTTNPDDNDLLIGRAVTLIFADNATDNFRLPCNPQTVSGSAPAFTATAKYIRDNMCFGTNSSTGFSELPWTMGNIAGSSSIGSTSRAGAPCVRTFTTGAASADGFNVTPLSGNPAIDLDGDTNWEVRFLVRLPEVTNIFTVYGFYQTAAWAGGSFNSCEDGSGNCAAVVFDTAASDTTWKLRTCAGFTCGVADTTVTVVANTTYEIRLWSAVAGTIRASINGANEVSRNTNIPTASYVPGLKGQTRTTAAKVVQWMDFWFQATGLTQ